MAKGIKVAKDSNDVSSVGTEDLYIDNDRPLFKLFKSGGGVQHFSGTASESYTINIEHYLGYVPFFLIYTDRNPGANRRLVTSSESTSPVTPDILCFVQNAGVSIISIVLNANGTAAIGDYGYNYLIYYDRINSTISDN